MCKFSLSTTAHYYAVENGYYEIPHKIDSEFITNLFGISKSALYEHLRKIEKTIFLSIFI
ncbi:MAG: helix-turn-helix domain-containing protein [Candidatus Lokiarchaeota archaeon]|nr:helix-turn-helix domain-containing protein [Candidatus Lokiarchaeota archaeon]